MARNAQRYVAGSPIGCTVESKTNLDIPLSTTRKKIWQLLFSHFCIDVATYIVYHQKYIHDLYHFLIHGDAP